MTNLQKILPLANSILQKHDLCENCLGRLFAKNLGLSSHKLLGKKLKQNKKMKKKCYICKNLFENLDFFLKLMLNASSNYSFSTFSVGSLIKPSIVDRDDYIRSKFKLKGIDSVKTDLTRELGKSFSRKTKKKIDFSDPDVTLTVNLKDDSCQIRAKSLILFGKYVKKIRNISQKQKSCANCSGKGCRTCEFHGIDEFDSIEGIISKFIFTSLGGTTAKFTWIGGEDKSSLVLGSGRPFFVKLNNPFKRSLSSTSFSSGSVEIKYLKVVSKTPSNPIKFLSTVKTVISSENILDSKSLRKLKNIVTSPTVIYENRGKRTEKKIYSIKYSKKSNHEFILLLKAEGGLPIKRFISSENVSPGVSQILENPCMCQEFDFLEIEIK